MAWTLCAAFSIVPGAYVVFVGPADLGWGWMLVTWAMLAYVPAALVGLALSRALPRRNRIRLALGFSVFPLVLLCAYIALAPVREARRKAREANATSTQLPESERSNMVQRERRPVPLFAVYDGRDRDQGR